MVRILNVQFMTERSKNEHKLNNQVPNRTVGTGFFSVFGRLGLVRTVIFVRISDTNFRLKSELVRISDVDCRVSFIKKYQNLVISIICK